MSLTGGCFCGYVTYSVEQDALDDVANCHCRLCRKSTGGTFVTWATVPRERLHWLGNKPASFRATAESERFFCPRCGAQLALYTRLAPRSIDFTLSTLDVADRFPPKKEVWISNRLAWVELYDLPHEDEETL